MDERNKNPHAIKTQEASIKKRILALLISIFSTLSLFAVHPINLPFAKWWEPAGLEVFKKAYPDVKFISSYDREENDWLIHVIVPDYKDSSKTVETNLYWCEGRFLPKDKLSQKWNFRQMLYKYKSEVPDPSTFTEEYIERIKLFTDRTNRANSAIDPPFLFDAIYDCKDRAHTESHIVKVPFLTLSINVHQRIKPIVERISKKIMDLPRDQEMEKFFATLTSTDGYAWRTVRDTQSRSFHSIGLAMDVLPKGYYQKVIYWSWQKQLRPDDWFMTPVEKRWSPPQRVIDIFKEEGFIWGGTWMVWDNMHFEYHPELLIYSK